MSTPRQILAAIFDMDGLLIDSEPLWDRAELDVMASLGVDISRRNELPDTLGLRIDMVVDLWYAHQPWVGPDRDEVTARIINRAISLVEEYKPLLPGVRDAIALCKAQGLKVGLASASPLHMLEKVLTMFGLRDSFDALASAEKLPYSKPHPQVYMDCAAKLGLIHLPVWRWKIRLTAWWRPKPHVCAPSLCRLKKADTIPVLPSQTSG